MVENDSLATLYYKSDRRNMSSRLHPVSVTRERKKIHIPEKYHANRDDRRVAKEHCLEKHENVTELEAAYAST